MPATFADLISATCLRLRMRNPFFATLALFARIRETEQLPTAATDGRDILINPTFWRSLSGAERDGVFLHEVLHAALLHVTRRKSRDPLLWNIAADIVVNGMIAEVAEVNLPAGAVIDPALAPLSVEEVYDHLLANATPCRMAGEGESGNGDGSGGYVLGMPDLQDPSEASGEDGERPMSAADLETHWQHALEQAKIIAETTRQGTVPAGMRREFGALSSAQLDWRSYLWRFLVQTPTDFTGFDRRFLGRGLYLDALAGEKVTVAVCVDTSGSIDAAQIRLLLAEVAGILCAYPHLTCLLWYADAACYGPYDLDPGAAIPAPDGGGGTDFRPFFAALDEYQGTDTPAVAVYLTDGYGTFPHDTPSTPTLWVLTPGGIDLDAAPFGESARLLRDEI